MSLCPFPAGLQLGRQRFPDGTVALAGVDLSVAPASSSTSSGCRAAARAPCCASPPGSARPATAPPRSATSSRTRPPPGLLLRGATRPALPREGSGLQVGGESRRGVGAVVTPWVRLVGVEWPGRCVSTPRRSAEPRARGCRRGALQRCQGGRWSPRSWLPDPGAGRTPGRVGPLLPGGLEPGTGAARVPRPPSWREVAGQRPVGPAHPGPRRPSLAG
jgi:hypothetical protein